MVLQVLSDSIVSYFYMSITLCNQFCEKQLQSFFFFFIFSFHLEFSGPDFHSGLHSRIQSFQTTTSLLLVEGPTSSTDVASATRWLLSFRTIQKGNNEGQRCTVQFDHTRTHICLQGKKTNKKKNASNRLSKPRTSRYCKWNYWPEQISLYNKNCLLASLTPSCKINTAICVLPPLCSTWCLIHV